jgi:hypothetical protein
MPEPVIAHVTLSTGEVVELRVQGWPEKPGAKLAKHATPLVVGKRLRADRGELRSVSRETGDAGTRRTDRETRAGRI